MKNVYVKAALQTIAFIAYIAVIAVGFTLLGDAVGTESARAIFYGVLGVVALVILYVILLARARYFETVDNLSKDK